MAMDLALIGYRGCGKTTVGKKLADRLWKKFVDIDDVIVKKAGKTIRDIFQLDGEPNFRALETEALFETLLIQDLILGVGGGTVMREDNRRMLKAAGGKIVYMRCEPEELLRRIRGDKRSAETRPSLTSLGGGIEEIQLKLAEREPIYRQLMDAELDVTNMSPEDVMVYLARLI